MTSNNPKQQLIEEASQAISPTIALLQTANHFIEAAQQTDLEDEANIEVKAGMFDDAIDKMVEKLNSLKGQRG